LVFGFGAGALACTEAHGVPDSDAVGEELSFGSGALVPGQTIGGVTLGMTYREVRSKLGIAIALGSNGVILAEYPLAALELIFSSSNSNLLNDDSVLIAGSISARRKHEGVVLPGQLRKDIESSLGAPTDQVGSVVYYEKGLGIDYDSEQGPEAKAKKVSIFKPYKSQQPVPEMAPVASEGPPGVTLVDPENLGTVDMHLHPGDFGRIPSATKQFIIQSTPGFTRLYSPSILADALDPYAPYLGIKAQTERAGVSHAVIFAVYTQKTTGFETNEDVEKLLTDPRNKAADGLPWAWGLASVNFFDGFLKDDGSVNHEVADARFKTLSSYFERRRDLFIGIKLAHPHQQVAFDDARYLGVYDVANRHGVPVYLHTGFSPFPGAKNEPAYYDPLGLENVIRNLPAVRFILGHVGQGDARSVNHALDLAAKYPNVYIEISALKRPILIDLHGHEVDEVGESDQYKYVLEQVKERKIVAKTIFGSDGPQSPGMVKSYVKLMEDTMKDKGYTAAEIQQVMAGNFARVYFPSAR
jgi:hypothetical protein